MPKSKSNTLSTNSDGYRMIVEKVGSYWKLYKSDITKWPSPSQLFEELEEALAPYGDSRAHRLNKLRGLYNKLTKQCFEDNGFDVPDLKSRREARKSCGSMNGVPTDQRMFFGAAAAYGANNNSEDDDEDSSSSSTRSNDNCEEDTSSTSMESNHSFCESETEFNSSFDSPDIASLSLSPKVPTETKQTPKKKVFNKQKTPQKNANSSIGLNVTCSDLDLNIYTPNIFIHDGRRVAAMTMWFPTHYDTCDVSAVVNDGGYKVTVEFCPPHEFLTPITQAATSMACVGSSLGETYAVLFGV